MYTALRFHLETICPITDADWSVFESCLEAKVYDKNEPLLTLGQVCKGIWFIKSGSSRSYLLNDGTEVCVAFTFENEFVTDFESLTKQQPSEVVIRALEKMEAIYFSRKSLIDLYKQAPVFLQVGQHIMENLLIQKDHYATLFTRLSPTQRYAHLLQHFPHIIQRVPLHHLASYLGIARETLSRIRQKK